MRLFLIGYLYRLYALYQFYTQIKQRHGAIFGLFLVSVFSARIAIESIKVQPSGLL